MMVLAHTAAGAAIGHLAPSTQAGVAVAFAAHALLDLPQHEDPTMRQEAMLTGASLVSAATLFGLRSKEFWGAFSCAAPDLEHVIPALRRRRRLYPTHRFGRLHNLLPTPRASLAGQVAASVVVLALVARSAARR
jgi:hypothetical protein